MGYRPHPRLADTNPDWPQGWGACDRCGMQTNLVKMTWDRQWAGPMLMNKRFLVCELCVDVPQQQLRSIVLPADPPGLMNARPEPYVMDETDYRKTQDDDFRITEDDENRVTQPSQSEATTEDPG